MDFSTFTLVKILDHERCIGFTKAKPERGVYYVADQMNLDASDENISFEHFLAALARLSKATLERYRRQALSSGKTRWSLEFIDSAIKELAGLPERNASEIDFSKFSIDRLAAQGRCIGYVGEGTEERLPGIYYVRDPSNPKKTDKPIMEKEDFEDALMRATSEKICYLYGMARRNPRFSWSLNLLEYAIYARGIDTEKFPLFSTPPYKEPAIAVAPEMTAGEAEKYIEMHDERERVVAAETAQALEDCYHAR